MTTDLTPHLLFPTCPDCARIGLPAISAHLVAMEAAIGHEALRAFLLAHGGRQYATRVTTPKHEVSGDIGKAYEWMRAEFGGMKVSVPKGPAGRSARLAFTIYTRLCEGWSLAQIATATDCDLRTVSLRKKFFQDMRVLPAALLNAPQTTTGLENSTC